MHGPLDGIRVIEVGTLISGPFAGRLLGDMGAEVIKIEAVVERHENIVASSRRAR